MPGVRVVNRRTHKGDGIWIDRRSPLGNRYIIGADGNRQEVIEKFRGRLPSLLRHNFQAKELFETIVAMAQREEGVDLICWCAPLPCHGDVIKEFVEAELGDGLEIIHEGATTLCRGPRCGPWPTQSPPGSQNVVLGRGKCTLRILWPLRGDLGEANIRGRIT